MITKLKPNQIFCFGSNTSGIHGKGAALTAKQKFGAIQGQGEGLQGQSYAIPTRFIDHGVFKSLPLGQIEAHVAKFLIFASQHSELEFFLTAIGTGYAGYTVDQISPFFVGSPPNVVWPDEFSQHEPNDEFSENVQLGQKI